MDVIKSPSVLILHKGIKRFNKKKNTVSYSNKLLSDFTRITSHRYRLLPTVLTKSPK